MRGRGRRRFRSCRHRCASDVLAYVSRPQGLTPRVRYTGGHRRSLTTQHRWHPRGGFASSCVRCFSACHLRSLWASHGFCPSLAIKNVRIQIWHCTCSRSQFCLLAILCTVYLCLMGRWSRLKVWIILISDRAFRCCYHLFSTSEKDQRSQKHRGETKHLHNEFPSQKCKGRTPAVSRRAMY